MASRVLLLCVSVVLAAAAAAEARDFVVGGANDAWKAPAQPDALAKWASANRFQIGDKLGKSSLAVVAVLVSSAAIWSKDRKHLLHKRKILHFSPVAQTYLLPMRAVFKFDGVADSVLEVTRDDYNRCSTASPLAVHKADAGAATVTLPRSGPYYFVGGAPGSCQKGERLHLVVMSEKHGRGRLRGLVPAPVPAPEQAAESPFAASFVGGPAAAPAPATGAAGRTAAAGNTVPLLVGAAAVLGALLVGC